MLNLLGLPHFPVLEVFQRPNIAYIANHKRTWPMKFTVRTRIQRFVIFAVAYARLLFAPSVEIAISLRRARIASSREGRSLVDDAGPNTPISTDLEQIERVCFW